MPARTDDFTGSNTTDYTGRTPSGGGTTWVQTRTPKHGISSNQGYSPSSGEAVSYLETSLADFDYTLKYVSNPDGFLGLVFRHNGATGAGEYFWYFRLAGNGWRLYKVDSGGSNLMDSDSVGASNGDVLRVVCSGSGITCYIGATQVTSVTDAFQATETKHGVYTNEANTFFDDLNIAELTPVVPTIVLTKGTPTSLTFAVSDGTPGPTPITRVGIYRGPNSDFDPDTEGTLVSAAGGATVTVGSIPADDADYWYLLRVTDNTAVDHDSERRAGSRWKRPAYLGFIGDSIMNGYPRDVTVPYKPSEYCIRYLRSLYGNRDTQHTNAAQDATDTTDWLPGGGNYSGAVTAFNAATEPLTGIVINLGVNDSYGNDDPVTVFRANLLAIIAGLRVDVTNWYDDPMFLVVAPTGTAPEHSNPNPDQQNSLPLYREEVRTIGEGTTDVFPGGLDLYKMFAEHTDDVPSGDRLLDDDLVHPTDLSYQHMGLAMAIDWARAADDLVASAGAAASNPFHGQMVTRP